MGGGGGGGGGYAVARAPSQKFGSMMMMLGRVRFEDLLVQEEEVLGEGTFGTVLRGTYEGEDVAIKKARDFRGSARVKELFRCGVKNSVGSLCAIFVGAEAGGIGCFPRGSTQSALPVTVVHSD